MAYDDLDDLLGATDEPQHSHNPPQMAGESELAAFWAVTTRQVRKLLSDGVIQKADGRLYDLQICTAAYLRHLSLKRSTTNSNLEVEKIRLTREQADAVELKNAILREEYVSAAEVKNTWAAVLRDVRASALAIPGRVQTRLPHLTVHDVKIIDNEIRLALTEVANDQVKGDVK